MTETKRMKVKNLKNSRKLYWNYELLQWLAYVDNWELSELHRDVKSRLPEDKEARNRLLLSWWVASHTYQDTLDFSFEIYCEPGLGHFVIASLLSAGPQFGDDVCGNEYGVGIYGKWERWISGSSTKYFVEAYNTLVEAEEAAAELDEEYFRDGEDEVEEERPVVKTTTTPRRTPRKRPRNQVG